MTILARFQLNTPSADLTFRKRFRLFFTVGTVVILLGCVKTAVHYFDLEFLQLNALLTSGIGGAIFIIGFLLSGILADYKEAERIPAEIRTAMEAINEISPALRRRSPISTSASAGGSSSTSSVF